MVTARKKGALKKSLVLWDKVENKNTCECV